MALGNYANNRNWNYGSPPDLDGVADLASLLRCVGHAEPEEDAVRLIDEFGTAGAVLSAEPERLARWVDERYVAVLHAAHRAMLSALRPERVARLETALTSTSRLLDYLRLRTGHAQVEAVYVLYLGKAMQLIREEQVARGTRHQVMIEVREIVRRALDLGAEAILLAHNHPSGSNIPSREDIAATTKLAASAAVFGIKLVDHVVVTRDTAYSFAAEGRL